MVFFSIILTIFSDKHLEECLNSIFSQTNSDFEVICIDTTNSEKTDEILSKFLMDTRLTRIKVDITVDNIGDIKNNLIESSTGKYLSFLTSNNVLSNPEVLEKISESSDNAELISSNIDVITENVTNNPFYNPIYNKYTEIGEDRVEEYGVPYHLSRNIIKKEYVVQNHITFRNMNHCEDILFLSEILSKISTYRHTPYIFCKEYLEDYGNITPSILTDYLICYKELLKIFTDKKEFEPILNKISENFIKIKDLKCDVPSYKEYKIIEKEIDEISDICTKNKYSFSYIVKRKLRYIKNRNHDKVTDFDVLISIIIPTYNVEEYLDDCLVSLINQSFENFEAIIVDDSSTDSTVDIIRYYEKIDSRIKFIEKEKKSGSGGSRNYGMKYARGKYIQFLDADDWLDLDCLEKLYSYAEEYETDIVIFKLINYETEEKTFYKNRYYSIPSLDDFKNKAFNLDDVEKKLFYIAVSPVNKLYSRHYLESINAVFPEKYIHQDNPFFFQTFCDAERVYLTDEYFYNRRRTDSSISTRLDGTQIGTIEIVEYILNVFINNTLYEKFKKPMLNLLVFKVRNRSKQVGEEFKEEYYKKAKRKFFKFMFTYGLIDDLKENLNQENKEFFEKIVYSDNYEKYLEMK